MTEPPRTRMSDRLAGHTKSWLSDFGSRAVRLWHLPLAAVSRNPMAFGGYFATKAGRL